MDYKLLLDTAVMTGELMLESGAETYRVEDTMHRMLSLSKLQTAEVFVTMTGFVATLDDPAIHSMTVVRRIRSRGTDLNRIDELNTLSRRLCTGDLSLEEAFRKVRLLKRQPVKAQAFLFATPVVTAAFGLTYGGSLTEALAAALTGFFLALCLYGCRRLRVQPFFGTLLGAAAASALAAGLLRLFPAFGSLDAVVIASIMPLVPGVAITNAVFDTLHGDYLSGTARTLEAFVTAAAVAMGIGIGLGF